MALRKAKHEKQVELKKKKAQEDEIKGCTFRPSRIKTPTALELEQAISHKYVEPSLRSFIMNDKSLTVMNAQAKEMFAFKMSKGSKLILKNKEEQNKSNPNIELKRKKSQEKKPLSIKVSQINNNKNNKILFNKYLTEYH